MALRVLLLSPRERAPRPDTDLRALTGELFVELRACPGLAVVHEAVGDLLGVERAVRRHHPDVVFNACESLDGRSDTEPLVPLLLEHLDVPFTGSSAAGLERCLRKAVTSTLLRQAGVPVPRAYEPDGVPSSAYPVIVKPEREDGSVGIGDDSVARDAAELQRALAKLISAGRPAMVQEYVEGREIAVAFLGWPKPTVLPPGEIEFSGGARILTYASKWDPSSEAYGATRAVAARLSPPLLERLSSLALRAARALDIRDYGRVDFRIDASGEPRAIDVNPNCDLALDGGFVRAARRAGLSRSDVLTTILAGAAYRARRAA